MIQHFILTRSCYRQKDLKYLRYRFRMMMNFCGASLAGQTRQDFTWVVRINPNSPIADEMKAYFAGLPFPVVCNASPAPEHDASDTISTQDGTWKDCLRNLLTDGTTHVLTTRLDDDDILAPDFVERLRGGVKEEKRPAAYNFPVGYVVTLSTAVGSKGIRWRMLRNQFASLISPREPLAIVNDVKHGDIEKLGPVRIVDGTPAFVWVRHPRTKSEGGRFRVHIPVKRLAGLFPVLEGVK